MAINYELLNKGGISLGTNFELLSEKPLDSRLVVPSLDGLQNYIDNAAAYEGMIAYVSSEKKHYEVKVIDGVLSYRPFGLTETELNDIITNATTAAMEFKGATATLPENPSKGDMWKVAGEEISITIDGVSAIVGDSIVYNGEKWFLIPSGDDIEDTWRPVDGVNNDAGLKFVDGDKTVAAVAADGTIKYNHATVAAPADVTAEGDEKTRTYITEVETDGYGHITGYKTATENVEDTNTTYAFEGQADESSVYFQVTSSEEGADAEVVYLDAYSKNEADGKFVAKETGKSLVSDDEIARLAEVDNYDDEEVRGLIGDNAQAIDDLEAYVGTIPTDDKYKDLSVVAYINKKAEETLAAAQGGSSETAASVKQQLDNYKSENDTRVKAVEDDIDAINNADTGILKQAKDYADGLAGNYDEAGAAAAVKSELSEEINGKVDKAIDHSLVADSEIKRLLNMSDEANKVEISENNGCIKIDGEEFVVYSHPSEHAMDQITGLNDALNAKVAKSDYESDKATFATKTELGNVDKKFENYTTTSAQQTIDAEQDRRLGVIEGDYVKAADIADFETKTNVAKVAEDLAAETKARTDADAGFETRIAALEGNFGDGEGTVEAQIEAAVKVVQDAVDAIEADYVKSTDIANFETKENVKEVSDELGAYKTSNDAALAEVKATAEAARTEDEVNSQIEAKITALNLATTYEPIGAETRAKAYADGLITDANLGQYTTEQEVKDIVDGVIKTATSKETLDSLVELVEYIDTHSGDAINMATAIGVLEGKVETIEKKPACEITATQISNWDNEVGAKALAETKLDASTFTEYSNAHAGDYTNKQIDDAIDADVKTAIDAEVLRANGAYDAKGAAADAQAAAEATAAGALATARTEITTEIGNAISGEVSRADGKYEEKGVAQGIVDALKLSETYEPIGAETRAIAAAEGKVNALAGNVYTKAEVYTKTEVENLMSWGEF